MKTESQPKEQSDQALIKELKSGFSEAAFERLLVRHGGMVLNVCRRQLSDRHLAEDAAQGVFLILWKKSGSLSRHPCIAGWLHEVAVNVCRNLQRAESARRRSEMETITKRTVMPHKEQKDQHLQQELDLALRRIPHIYRLPLIQFHLQGHTIEEIAQSLGASASTIATRLARGREKLGQQLQRAGFTASVGSVAALLASSAQAATLPPEIVSRAIHLSGATTAGGTAITASHLSATHFAVQETLKMIDRMEKARLVLNVTVTMTVVTLGIAAWGLSGYRAFADEGPGTVAQLSEQEKQQFALLQGVWIVEKRSTGGLDVPPEIIEATKERYVFETGRLTRLQTNPRTGEETGGQVLKVTLRPGANPREIDLSGDPRAPNLVIRGIYKIEGDKLTVCLGRSSREEGSPRGAYRESVRPADFAIQPGDNRSLESLRRAPIAK